MQRQKLITTIKNVTEKKKKSSKAKLDFIASIKLTTTDQGRGEGGVVEGKKKRKKSKRIYRTSQNTKINVFLGLLMSESFPSLGVTVHLTSLGCPPILR